MGLCVLLGLLMWKQWERRKGKRASSLPEETGAQREHRLSQDQGSIRAVNDGLSDTKAAKLTSPKFGYINMRVSKQPGSLHTWLPAEAQVGHRRECHFSD